jgi:hypothetical protein
MKWVLSRRYRQFQTMGCLYVFNEDHSFFNCRTLELPWLNNKPNVSCYPGEAVYDVEKYKRPNGRWAFWVKNVPGRSGILFHPGNYASIYKTDSEGCTLPGMAYDDLNRDGYIDILESQDAMNRLLYLMPDKFKLYVL